MCLIWLIPCSYRLQYSKLTLHCFIRQAHLAPQNLEERSGRMQSVGQQHHNIMVTYGDIRQVRCKTNNWKKKCNSLTNSKLVSDLREQMKNLHSNVRIASSHWYWSTRPNKNVRADIFEKHRNLVFWYVSFRQKFHKIMVCDMFSCSVTNYLAKATFAIHETGWRVVHVFTCFHCAVHFEQTINQV